MTVMVTLAETDAGWIVTGDDSEKILTFPVNTARRLCHRKSAGGRYPAGGGGAICSCRPVGVSGDA